MEEQKIKTDKNEDIGRRDTCRGSSGINDELIINLRNLSHTMRFLYEGKGSQKRVMIVLKEFGGRVTQRELTERLGIQPGSASEVIAKLESAGYIRRTPNETDRRTVDIELTKEGEAFAKEARAQRILRHEQMFSCLSDDEKKQFLSLLEKINRDWEIRYQDTREDKWYKHYPDRNHKNMQRQKGE